jgi:hypothetical protein
MRTSYSNYTVPGPSLTDTFKIINQMVEDGVIETYAIGGATAAFFYVEPDTTFDIDIFCVISGFEEDALDMLAPIYGYLKKRGHHAQAEGVVVAGALVQFLPVFNPLNDEAVEQANNLVYSGVPVRVMRPEHLMAIMLQTGRPKDFARIARFLEAKAFDEKTLADIVSRHNLDAKWKVLRRLGGLPT